MRFSCVDLGLGLFSQYYIGAYVSGNEMRCILVDFALGLLICASYWAPGRSCDADFPG